MALERKTSGQIQAGRDGSLAVFSIKNGGIYRDETWDLNLGFHPQRTVNGGVSEVTPKDHLENKKNTSISRLYPNYKLQNIALFSGHFRNLNWRYLPYIRPI